ncbi:MAG: leucyl aminopeptidase family protein [Deltaproteobacteria bacterium]|nr:leucyl aminopeptidase family protein [Deltaproteobacteria bacterium]
MLELAFANARTTTTGFTHVVVVASATRAQAKLPTGLFDRRRAQLYAALVAQAKPGDRGALVSTLSDDPTWLHVAVLPDRLSRYNSPSRADSIRHTLEQVRWGAKGKALVVLLIDDPAHLLAAANAVARALPGFEARREPSAMRVQIAAFGPDGQPLLPDARVRATVEYARVAARLVDTPPSQLHPKALADEARALIGKGVVIEEIVGDALLAKGLGGIHAVGRAAVEAPRMLVARCGPANAPLHVALVGKGICFDTGGLHIKARGMMETMKADMGGAAAVLGAFCTLLREALPIRVSLVLCIAENAVDARSYKPDDILHMHSGKTVEINNTDAEGRLLLADGVSWAARELGADVVIDAATLTGAQLVATGLVHAAVMSNDAALETLAVEAGRASGDLVHPLPFAPELYMHEFRSPIADMRNSVANRNNAQSSCAAQFVYSHIADAPDAARRRWCHIDLAGPAFPKERATGYGVALISTLVRRLAEQAPIAIAQGGAAKRGDAATSGRRSKRRAR